MDNLFRILAVPTVSVRQRVVASSLNFRDEVEVLVCNYISFDRALTVRASEGITGQTFISDDLVFKFMTHLDYEDRFFSCFLEFWANNFIRHYYSSVAQVVMMVETDVLKEVILKI